MAASPTAAETVAPDLTVPSPRIVMEDDVADSVAEAEFFEDTYEIIKEITQETWLVRRREDPETTYLGFPWDVSATAPLLQDLFDRGVDRPVDALLNHPNLINYINTIPAGTPHGTTVRQGALSLWDYCDAGSLRRFMDRTTVPQQSFERDGDGGEVVTKWLPESLCWHVVVSVMSALAWLHEGYREVDTIEEGPDGQPRRMAEAETRQDRDEDWLSVLHRGLTPSAIFFQHPKGIEDYGLCKLGNFNNAFVSGHVNDLSTGHVVCSEVGEGRLLTVIDNTKGENIYDIERAERPYFKGTEVFQLGRVLYLMMTRQELPDKEECRNCGVQHWIDGGAQECPIHQDASPFDLEGKLVELAEGYTEELLEVLRMLLSRYRESVDTAVVYTRVKDWYLRWKGDYPEGRKYKDYWDDMVQRDINQKKKHEEDKKNAEAQSAPDATDYVQLAIQWALQNRTDDTEPVDPVDPTGSVSA